VHGIFLWVRNNETVRQQMEILARNHYMSKEDRDPIECSLFYMALRKRKLLLGLWRTANGHKEQAAMLKFLANNFDEQRWKTAALKNAYALLGKQRYEYAAAFFLLGDRLRDAVNVCLKHLDDFQLAIAICRVYEGDEGLVLKSIFEEHIIPLAIKTGDRWLASLSFWFLNQRDRAVKAIMVPLETLCDNSMIQSPSPTPTESPDAALIVLYKQLKEKSIQTLRGASEISPETEYFFVLRSIFAYDRMGCPLLALHLAKTWRFTHESISKNPDRILKSRRRTTIFDIPLLNHDTRISSGFVNFNNWSWNNDNDSTSPISAGGRNRASDLFADEPSSYFNAYNNSPTTTSFNNDADSAEIISGDSWGWNSPKSDISANQNFNSRVFSPGDDSSSVNTTGDFWSSNTESTTLLEDIDFDDCKADLVKRSLQHLLDAVTIAFENSKLFVSNPYYSNYIDRIKDGLKSVCQSGCTRMQIEGYTPLASAVHGSTVNVIGVIKSFKQKRKCNGSTDWHCSFMVVDQSLPDIERGISVSLFRAHNEDLPDIQCPGSIFVGVKLKVDKFYDALQLISYKNESTCLVFKEKIEERMLSCAMKLRSEEIINYAIMLQKWWINKIGLHGDGGGNNNQLHHKVRQRLKIRELEKNVFCDLVAEIEDKDSTTELYITDYTENKYLNASSKHILQVSLWDENRLEGQSLRVGMMVLLQNVRAKVNNYNTFQAVMHGDPGTRRSRITVLNSSCPEVEELLKWKFQFTKTQQTICAPATQIDNNLTKVVNCQVTSITSITDILKVQKINKYRTRGKIVSFLPLNFKNFIRPFCRICSTILFECKSEAEIVKCPTCLNNVKYIYDFWLLFRSEDDVSTIQVNVGGKHAINFLKGLKPGMAKKRTETYKKFEESLRKLLRNLLKNDDTTKLIDFCIESYIDR
ncbi:14582_t:CDS:10, partial [Acaulospora morrowiae]